MFKLRDKGFWCRLLIMWLAGIDLRLTILAMPPVLPLVHRDLALDEKGIAILSGLPPLMLGLVAVPGSLLISRIGARRALIVGLIAVAAASGLRGVGPSELMLFGMTFIMGAGISILQPAMPSLVSQWFPESVALATAVYGNGMLIGEVFGASLTIPVILPLVSGSWEASFVIWAVPVLVTALLVMTFTPHRPLGAVRARALWWPDWRNRLTWQLGLMLGGGSSLYFASNAFLPDYLHATARPELVGTCLTALNAGQLPASLIILLFARRLSGKRTPLLAVGLIALISAVALLAPSDTAIIAGAAGVGFTTAFVLILTLTLPPLLTHSGDVHRVSAGMFGIGYILSFLVPLLGGAIWDATQAITAAFLPGIVGALIVLAMAATVRLPERPDHSSSV